MVTEILTVDGMHCASCSSRVEKTLRNLEGVQSANVNLASKEAAVVYDQDKLHLSVIKDAIRDAGYEVT